jgi:hypothetical protein
MCVLDRDAGSRNLAIGIGILWSLRSGHHGTALADLRLRSESPPALSAAARSTWSRAGARLPGSDDRGWGQPSPAIGRSSHSF